MVAALPFVILIAALLIQCAIGGYALWACANAARVAARAALVGGDLDRAARSALPDAFENHLTVRAEEQSVEVSFELPLLVSAGSLRVPIEVGSGLPLAAGVGAAP
ncbi:MAG: hypothetical protein H0U42_08775 [Thermoleophilaceae bacterium]|nr:hypothetical protein [Thermoleophilaceae bacterium]